MWIISFLPEWVFHTLLIVSILGVTAGFVLGMIPVVKRYAIPIRIISLMSLCLALYLEGGLADYREWEMKAAEMQVKLAEMETKLAQADTKVIEKVVVQTKIIREKGKDVVKYVDREIVKYDTKFLPGGECELPKEFFKAYNDSLGKENK